MLRLLTVCLWLVLGGTATAELREPEIYKTVTGVAIKGYDPVAYHTERRAVQGQAVHAYEWKDATWHFASAQNRDLFAAEPERYAPQYGGYCAWAVARGRTAPVNPTIFRIFDNKLYMNLNMKIHKEWLGRHEVFISRADTAWPGVLVLAD